MARRLKLGITPLQPEMHQANPKLFKKAIAMRLLWLLLPWSISKNLPRWLSDPIIFSWIIIPPNFLWPWWYTGPGDELPPIYTAPAETYEPGIDLPPGTIINQFYPPAGAGPPGFTIPGGELLYDYSRPYVPAAPGTSLPIGSQVIAAGEPDPALTGTGILPEAQRAAKVSKWISIYPAKTALPGQAKLKKPQADQKKLTEGLIHIPGTSLPAGWKAGDPLPPGFAYQGGASVPEGMTIYLPATIIEQPVYTQDPALTLEQLAPLLADYYATPPKPPQAPAALPSITEHFTIDAGVQCNNLNTADWATLHDKANCNSVFLSSYEQDISFMYRHPAGTLHNILRSTWTFQVSPDYSTWHLEAGQFWLPVMSSTGGEIIAQLCPGPTNTVADYSRFYNYFTSHIVPVEQAINKLNFTTAMVNYINAQQFSIFTLMTRNYNYDVLNVQPPADTNLSVVSNWEASPADFFTPQLVLRFRRNN